MSSSEILQSMQKLNTLGSVLYIAAHPDDENTRLLAWLANERKYRTAYLSLTRGDGGQNLIGSEQGEFLGLIRTEELLAARRIDGAEQWFTRATDFGYSKNPEETFRFWNKNEVLADVVYAIRKFRPDVVITRFPTTGEGGHGHHTASAILALEAFDMAGDPSKFPEQLIEVDVWQPRRLFWNTFNFGTTNTTGPDQLKIDVGGYNPLLGKSYGEIAALSRSCHKSQGFGSAMQRGTQYEYFKQLRGDTARKDLFEGINTHWNRLSSGEKISKLIHFCIRSFDPGRPEKSIPVLAQINRAIDALHIKADLSALRWWKVHKQAELEELMLACAGIWMETTAPDYSVVPRQTVEMSSRVIVRNAVRVKLGLSYGYYDSVLHADLNRDQMFVHKRQVLISERTGTYTSPYWLDRRSFAIREASGQPQNDAQYDVVYRFKIEDTEIVRVLPICYKQTDPVKGELYRPLEILPPATVNPGEKILLMGSAQTKSVFFLVKAHTDQVKGELLLTADKRCRIELPDPYFDLPKKGDEKWMEARVTVLDPDFEGSIEANLLIGKRPYGYSIQRVDYEHIPNRLILSQAKVKVLRFDLKLAGRRIGYIQGAGDEVAANLKQIGYDVVPLSEEQIRNSDLSVYDAIVCGIRAYNTNAHLPLCHQPLMDYVQKGGRLLVQYNTNSRVGPLETHIGPYPFSISRNRVTDENAPVSFLDSSCPLLHYPNRISRKDFEGWVQERGVYFAGDTDSTYRHVLGMSDPGESEQKGSLIWTPYGKGFFIYTGLSFFRQLPAGVPGAYRLFVNMLSMPASKP